MATFSALVKIFSTKFFGNTKVAGLGKIFIQQKFSHIQWCSGRLPLPHTRVQLPSSGVRRYFGVRGLRIGNSAIAKAGYAHQSLGGHAPPGNFGCSHPFRAILVYSEHIGWQIATSITNFRDLFAILLGRSSAKTLQIKACSTKTLEIAMLQKIMHAESRLHAS